MSETPKKTITVEEPENRNEIPVITDEMSEAVTEALQQGSYKALLGNGVLRASSGDGDERNWSIGTMTFEGDGKTWQESFNQLLRKLRDEYDIEEKTPQEQPLDKKEPKGKVRQWIKNTFGL